MAGAVWTDERRGSVGRSEAGRHRDRFGDLLRRYRLAAGLTQEELAERAGISARTVSDLERGVYRAPRRDTLHLLEDGLSLSGADRAALETTVVRTRQTPATPRIVSIVDAHSRSTHQHGHEAACAPAREPVSASCEAGRFNLPMQPTPFLGRPRELATVRERLLGSEVRLLTLTGPGGIGKTRLAVQAAGELLSYFPDGVCFVSLASVADPALVHCYS